MMMTDKEFLDLVVQCSKANLQVLDGAISKARVDELICRRDAEVARRQERMMSDEQLTALLRKYTEAKVACAIGRMPRDELKQIEYQWEAQCEIRRRVKGDPQTKRLNNT